MRYLVFLLGVLLVSCGTETTHNEDIQTVITSSNTQPKDSVIIEEPADVLVGFPRFFFVKDSLEFELENVKILADTYSSEKINFSQLEKDTAYFIMLEFLKEIRIASEDDKALYEYDEIKESEIAQYYKDFGISIESAEGEYYCVPDYSYLTQLFKDDLSPDLDIYKDFLEVSNRHIFDDGGLMITWMELASHIIETEKSYKKLKYSEFSDEILNEYISLSNVLMFGSENSIIIESNDTVKSLTPEVFEVYEFLIENDSLYNSGSIFKEHLNNLSEVNFDLTNDNLVTMSRLKIKKILLLVTPAEYNRQFSD